MIDYTKTRITLTKAVRVYFLIMEPFTWRQFSRIRPSDEGSPPLQLHPL